MPGRRTALAWLFVAPWAAWAAVRLVGAGGGFPLVQLIAFTPYALPLAAAGGLVAALLRRRAPAAVAAATVLALAAVLAPRAIGDGGGEGGVRLRVMTANLHFGDVPPDALLELARRERVDVLAVQELTDPAARALDAAGAGELLPHHVITPRPGGAGTGVYARFPLRVLAPPRGTTFAMTAAAVAVPGAAPVALLSVHTAAPHDRAATSAWDQDMRSLPGPATAGRMQLLVGDFNATLDHRELRDLLARGYRDAADRAGAGLRPTWQGTIPAGLTLDHVLAPGAVAVHAFDVRALPRSDHRAAVADLGLPRAAP
jgi:endonuclease/exonuclease/phosphatase family metal-dependent hydrolase